MRKKHRQAAQPPRRARTLIKLAIVPLLFLNACDARRPSPAGQVAAPQNAEQTETDFEAERKEIAAEAKRYADKINKEFRIDIAARTNCLALLPFPPGYTAFPITVERVGSKLEARWRWVHDRSLDGREEREDYHGRKWSDFIGQMQPGDDLWFFSSSPLSWWELFGCEGYAILRKGMVVDQFITLIS